MATIMTLPICCQCKQVTDERIGASAEVGWTHLQTYLDRHHIDQGGVQLSHTYCPSCYDKQARAWFLPSAA